MVNRITYGNICLAIWNWRNKEEHNEEFMIPYDPIECILQRKKEYEEVIRMHNEVKTRDKSIMMIEWTPLKSNMVKLNVDGACKDETASGCGGVIRDNNEMWISSFAKSLGKCSVLIT